MCKFRYDVEHGLAVVFASDGTVSVGGQDDVLWTDQELLMADDSAEAAYRTAGENEYEHV